MSFFSALHLVVREGQGRTRLLLRALRSRNYRLFVEGQGISLIGRGIIREKAL
ncbi:MAG: hypothetical protein V1844_23380 [Pseudomonadota bacterium]